MAAGLNRFEGGRFVTYRARDGLGVRRDLLALRGPRGTPLDRHVRRRRDPLRRRALPNFTTRDGLAHDVVMSTYQDAEGTYWFATRGGLCRYRDGRFTTYRQKEGVFHDAPQSVHRGRAGIPLADEQPRRLPRFRTAELAAAAGAGPHRRPGDVHDRDRA